MRKLRLFRREGEDHRAALEPRARRGYGPSNIRDIVVHEQTDPDYAEAQPDHRGEGKAGRGAGQGGERPKTRAGDENREGAHGDATASNTGEARQLTKPTSTPTPRPDLTKEQRARLIAATEKRRGT
jgi:hypothetical protein